MATARAARQLTNLPGQATPFIGREQLLEALRARLQRDDVRLLTLTGPGGTGKTRLAVQVAADLLGTFEDGVIFVSLAPVADPDLVPSTIAEVLKVKERPGQPVLASLKGYLRDKRLLLVLDNFEHLAKAAPNVAELLAACPRLRALATSRTMLHLYGEHAFPVPPLALPDRGAAPTAQHVALYESANFFVARAQAARPDFALTDDNAAAVADVCHRLDGLPLAIELAAARLRVLPLPALLDRMERRLPLLTGGPRDQPARQRTLRETIAWSYDLLDSDEQALFRRLAVFQGCGLDAIEAVCCAPSTQPGSSSIAVRPLDVDALDGVQSLVDKSLLRQEATADGQPWYAMLETVREFALERLAESDEADVIHRRLVMYYLSLAESADPKLVRPEQRTWLARLDREHDNLRVALRWSAARGYAEPAFRLAVALWWFWAVHGHIREGRQVLDGMLARFQPREAAGRMAAARARALQAAGYLACFQDDHTAARQLHEQAADLFRAQGDAIGVASALGALGQAAAMQGDYGAAREFLEEALRRARERGDPVAIYVRLHDLATIAHMQGEYKLARALSADASATNIEAGSPRMFSMGQLNPGLLLEDQGDFAAAGALYEQALIRSRQAGDRRNVALVLAKLGRVAAARGDYAAAHDSLGESIVIHQELGDMAGVALGLEGFAALAAAQDQPVRALQLAAAAAALRESINAQLSPTAQAGLDGRLRPARGALDERAAAAAWAAGRALSLDEAISEALHPPAEHAGDVSTGSPLGSPATVLSRREQEVATLIGRGLTNRQIATELVITEGTAANHVLHILDKLGVSSRAQVAVWAAECGLLAKGA